MRPSRNALISALLLLAAGAAPDALAAQVRPREARRAAPAALEPAATAGGQLDQVVRATRGEDAATRRVPVKPLSAGDKAEVLRVALDMDALVPSGIATALRLTAHRPYVAGQGYIDALSPEFAGGGKPDGYWVLTARVKATPSAQSGGWSSRTGQMLSDMTAPRMEAYFKPSVANKALLLDFAVRLRDNVPVTFTMLVGGGNDWMTQEQTLTGAGDHHLLAVIMPKNTEWYSVVLRPERASGTVETWVDVDYLEITATK